ncbi:MAG: hypothetical protein P8I94_01730 [Emcibacteraceae bacterium]|nr:hypothetical protein [Emcibacteraceae bacterium]
MSDKSLRKFNYSLGLREFEMNLYPLLTPLPEEAGDLRDFHALWVRLKGDQKIPSRKDITFETLKGWHSSVRIVDLGKDKNSPKQNIILGEVFKQYWGTETMYQQFMKSDVASEKDKMNYQKCLACFMEYNYAISIGVAPDPMGSIKRIAWLDLPLSNGENDNISFLIAALIPID